MPADRPALFVSQGCVVHRNTSTPTHLWTNPICIDYLLRLPFLCLFLTVGVHLRVFVRCPGPSVPSVPERVRFLDRVVRPPPGTCPQQTRPLSYQVSTLFSTIVPG